MIIYLSPLICRIFWIGWMLSKGFRLRHRKIIRDTWIGFFFGFGKIFFVNQPQSVTIPIKGETKISFVLSDNFPCIFHHFNFCWNRNLWLGARWGNRGNLFTEFSIRISMTC